MQDHAPNRRSSFELTGFRDEGYRELQRSYWLSMAFQDRTYLNMRVFRSVTLLPLLAMSLLTSLIDSNHTPSGLCEENSSLSEELFLTPDSMPA
jgi:hypothetical protein